MVGISLGFFTMAGDIRLAANTPNVFAAINMYRNIKSIFSLLQFF